LLKDEPSEKQLQIIERLFARFAFAYDGEKYRAWEQDNAKLTWVQFLGDATLDDIKEALTKALEIEYIYELPSATEFAALCGIKPAEAPAPVIDGVDTGTGEIIDPEPSGEAPAGPKWARDLFERHKTENLPIDSIHMYQRALRMGD
jgi:hypothetical protein